MKSLLDKVIILFCIGIYIILNEANTTEIVGMFLCICLFCMFEYLRDKKIIYFGYSIFILVSIIVPEFALWIPVLLYDMFYEKMYIHSVIASLICIYDLINKGENVIVFILILVALTLAYTTKRYNEVFIVNIKQRDDSKELELLLKSENKNLMEKQDYEIHIATLQERNRISREIHDNVGHLLSRTILQMGALKAVNNQDTLKEPIEDVKNTIDEAMTSIRDSVHNLYDESLDLQSAIKKLIKEYHGYEVHLTYDLPENVEKGLRYTFLMIIKEAFANVVKHSNATKIWIIIQSYNEVYQFSFRDNGSNFTENLEMGIGLISIKERIEAFGGNIHVKHQDGFLIFATIPRKDTK